VLFYGVSGVILYSYQFCLTDLDYLPLTKSRTGETAKIKAETRQRMSVQADLDNSWCFTTSEGSAWVTVT